MPRAGTKPKASLNTFSGSQLLHSSMHTLIFCTNAAELSHFLRKGNTAPCYSSNIFYSPDFPTCHPSQRAAPEACTPILNLELWHSCFAGSILCHRTTVTTAHPAASWVLPVPELLYPRKDTFPKAVWGGEERYHYNPTPAPPSKTIKERKKATTRWLHQR